MACWSDRTDSVRRARPLGPAPTALRAAVLLLSVLTLAGCTSFRDYVRNGLKVGPNYVEPPAPLAPQWIDATDQRVRTDSDDLAGWAFYSGLFGWEAKPMSVDKTDYIVFHASNGMVAGMYQITAEMQGMPPCWLPYFLVEDTDAAVDHARALGAQVHLPPMDVPTVGRLSMLQDPQGAMFYVITFFPPAGAGS